MLRKSLIFFAVVFFAVLHLGYTFACGMYLYEKSGGVTQQGKWTKFGGAPFAWAIPITLPGTLLMVAEERPTRVLEQPKGQLGFLLVLLGSVATAWAIVMTIDSCFRRKTSVFGRYGWRAVLIFLGLIWIPVPEQIAFVYQYTVLY